MSARANTGAVFGLESPTLSGTTTNTRSHAKLHKQPPTPTDQVQCAPPLLPICSTSEQKISVMFLAFYEGHPYGIGLKMYSLIKDNCLLLV